MKRCQLKPTIALPLLLILAVILTCSSSQRPSAAEEEAEGTTLWANSYSGEALNQRTSIKCVAEGAHGYYLFAGNSLSLSPPVEKKVFFGTVNQSGEVLPQDGWKFVSPAIEEVECIRPTSDGGYIAWGKGSGITQFIVKFEVNPYALYSDSAASNATPLWAHWLSEDVAGDARYDVVKVLETQDGYFVVGNIWYAIGAVFKSYPLVIRLDGTGEVLWTQQYEGSSTYHPVHDAEIAGDDGLIVVGGRDSVGVFPEAFAFKLFANGAIHWTRLFTDLDQITTITKDQSGDYYLAGQTNAGQLWLAKMLENSALPWQKQLPGITNPIRRLIVSYNRLVALSGEEAPASASGADPSGILQFDLSGDFKKQYWLQDDGLFVEDLIGLRNGRFLMAGTLKNELGTAQSFMMTVEEDLSFDSCYLGTTIPATAQTVSAANQLNPLFTRNTIDTFQLDIPIGTSSFVLQRGTLCSGVEPADSDGDGLLDKWEEEGYDYDNDGVPDVRIDLWGADKNIPDIFVEVDWMGNGTVDFEPEEDALRRATETYEARSYRLHIDAGPTSIDHIRDEAWSTDGQGGAIPFQENVDYDGLFEIMEANFDPARRKIFHYAIFANDFPRKDSCPTGFAPLNSQIFTVHARSIFFNNGCHRSHPGNVNEQTGTFLHELGHNMGLQHGGDDDLKNKPNYLSVMNYLFQTSGLILNGTDACEDGCFDYSAWTLPTLQEDELYEKNGIGPIGTDMYGSKYYCSPPPLENIDRIDNINEPIDWNCNLLTQNGSVAADINGDRSYDTLTGHDDWSVIDLNASFCTLRPGAQCAFELVQPSTAALAAPLGATATTPENVIDELTWEEDLLIPRVSDTRLQIKPEHTPAELDPGEVITVQLELFTIDANDVQGTTIEVLLPDDFTYQANSTQGITTDEPVIIGNMLSWGTFTISAGSPAETLQFEVAVAGEIGLFIMDMDSTSTNGINVPAALRVDVGKRLFIPVIQR